MGVQERKLREKTRLRKKIIKSATKLFLDHGYEGASIRMIAKDIEYSPATIYLHFKDKQALFSLIIEEAFQMFHSNLEDAKIIADPLSRLQELCKRYVQFAKQEPLYYEIIFLERAGIDQDGSHLIYTQRTHDLFTRTIQDCKRNNYFLSKNPESLALTIWAFIHGLATLELQSRIDYIDSNQRALLLEESLKTFFGLLRAA
jgi:AcrR family transcriptional regulator